MTDFRILVFPVAIALMSGWLPVANAQGVTFDDVCALGTTVNCWGFEDESDLYYVWDRNSTCESDPFLTSHPNGRNSYGLNRRTLGNTTTKTTSNGGCIYPKRDSTYAASGNSSLKFVYNQPTGSNPSGNFNPVFKRLGTPGNYSFAQFGKGGEFWVRFSMRQGRGLIDTFFKTDSGSTTTPKRLIVHGRSSSSNLEETIIDQKTAKLPVMYSNQGWEIYGIQDHIGCTAKAYKSLGYPEPPCRRMVAEQWRTYQVHVIVADNATLNNGVVELYLDDELEPIIRVTDSEMHPGSGFIMQPLPYTEDADWDVTNGYGNLTFTLFTTGKNSTQAVPADAAMWIDDVVVSRVRVPPLDGTTPVDSVPPAAPVDLITQ